MARTLLPLLCLLLPLGGRPAVPPEATVRLVVAAPLPPLDGAHLSMRLVEVTYAPGDSSPPHRHPCPVTGYVLAGHLRVAVDGGVDSTFGPGEAFTEAPGAVHRVSANASRTEPVRFLAYFTCDNDRPRTSPVAP